MIAPTVSRMVWFFPQPGDPIPHQVGVELSAQVAFVHADGTLNLSVLDMYGTPHPRQRVPLVQDGGDPLEGGYCTWMPYQRGQAAKTEQLEAQLVSRDYRPFSITADRA